MTDFSSKMVGELGAAQNAHREHVAALHEFQAACLRYDWKAAEAARLKVVATLESHLDHMASAHRHMQAEAPRK